MDNPIGMQILNSEDQLIHDVFGSILCDFEVSDPQVIEHIFAFHVFKYKIVLFKVLKKIKHFDNIRMLAHLKNFDLLPLLVLFNRFHLSFLDYLDGSLVPGAVMCGKLHLTELSFAKNTTVKLVIF